MKISLMVTEFQNFATFFEPYSEDMPPNSRIFNPFLRIFYSSKGIPCDSENFQTTQCIMRINAIQF